VISPKWQRRLVAIEKALRERTQRARPFPDYEHLDALLRLNMPEYFQARVKQVIEGVKERQRLEAEWKTGRLEQDSNGAAHPELPLGLPDWFR
jgi:hypothetical protein